MNKDALYLFLDSFLGLEYKNKVLLIELLKDKPSIKDSLTENKSALIKTLGENVFNTIFSACTNEYFEYVKSIYKRKGITPITFLSKDYPQELKNAPCPPLVLYTAGNLSLLKDKLFAITGSRKNLQSTLSLTQSYAEDLISAGFTLVTGISDGVEETVIKTALKTGKIIVVTAGGFDKIYPSKNTNLFEEVKKNGLVISEYPPEFIPKPFNFPVVTRIIAGISEGVLIASGGKKSGTRHTVEYADGLSKKIFAFPYNVGSCYGEGNNYYIKTGVATLTDSVEDVLSAFNVKKEIKQKSDNLSEKERKVFDIIKKEPIHIDKIRALSAMQINELTPILMMLEIKQYIAKNSGNVYSATGKE